MAGEDTVRAAIIEALPCDVVAWPIDIARRTGSSPSDVTAILRKGHGAWPEITAIKQDGSPMILERKLAGLVAQGFDNAGSAGRHSLVA